MKSIETKWKGWRFRSRTEARWAVFLEKLGIGFEYEPEGFVLPSGPYLPDFVLTSFPSEVPPGEEFQRVWLEIKGKDATEEEHQKCAELARSTGELVLLATGAPDLAAQVLVFNPDVPRVVEGLMPLLIGPLTFVEIVGDGVSMVCVGRPARGRDAHLESDDEEGAAFNEAWNQFAGPYCRVLGIKGAVFQHEQTPFGLTQRLRDAFDAARSARFEFGETDQRWKR